MDEKLYTYRIIYTDDLNLTYKRMTTIAHNSNNAKIVCMESNKKMVIVDCIRLAK